MKNLNNLKYLPRSIISGKVTIGRLLLDEIRVGLSGIIS